MTEEQRQGLTRREVLKKGAMLGGTVLWVVPVVQAVGMSPAMAQIPSETSCCLKITDVNAFAVAGDGGSNDVRIEVTVQNCGTHSTDFNVHVQLRRVPVVGGTPGAPVSVADIPFGALAPSEDGTNGVNDFNLLAGDYIWQAHGTYFCPGIGDGPLDHGPGPYWVESSQITV